MVANHKPTGRAVSMPVGLVTGVGFMAVWTLLGAMVVAKLVDSEIIQESAIGYGAAAILLSASFGGALVSFGRIKRQRMAVCFAAGGIYFLILLGTTALFFGGQYSGAGVTALLILAGSGAAVLLGLNGGAGKRRKAYKIRHS